MIIQRQNPAYRSTYLKYFSCETFVIIFFYTLDRSQVNDLLLYIFLISRQIFSERDLFICLRDYQEL